MGYLAIAFVVLIPVMCYHVIRAGLPKSILFIVIPGYVALALNAYTIFRNSKSK
jgi:hypothetical protein